MQSVDEEQQIKLGGRSSIFRQVAISFRIALKIEMKHLRLALKNVGLPSPDLSFGGGLEGWSEKKIILLIYEIFIKNRLILFTCDFYFFA